MKNNVEISLPTIITAIANSEFEGFVAGTLYSQGWSIIYRGLDLDSIEAFVSNNPDIAQNALLIYTPDLHTKQSLNIKFKKTQDHDKR
jgi:hypothetical protein